MGAAGATAVRLRRAGLRVTASRVATYDAVAAAPHADADTIARAVRARLGAVSTQGVYDALHALTGQGLLRRIEPAGSPARWETRTGDNHHHVVCRSCGRTHDVDCALAGEVSGTPGAAPCLTAPQTHGFVLDEAEVVWWGTCPACQTGRPSDPPPDLPPATPSDPTRTRRSA